MVRNQVSESQSMLQSPTPTAVSSNRRNTATSPHAWRAVSTRNQIRQRALSWRHICWRENCSRECENKRLAANTIESKTIAWCMSIGKFVPHDKSIDKTLVPAATTPTSMSDIKTQLFRHAKYRVTPSPACNTRARQHAECRKTRDLDMHWKIDERSSRERASHPVNTRNDSQDLNEISIGKIINDQPAYLRLRTHDDYLENQRRQCETSETTYN